VAFPAGRSTWTGSISGAWLSLAVVLATLATTPAVALAQRVGASLGVSATVLPPIIRQAVELVSFRVVRKGIARLETTTPIPGAVSLIVMSTVSSSANGFVPVAQPPALVEAASRRDWAEGATLSPDARAPRWGYEIQLARTPVGSDSNDVAVRITYLIVPGT
jgi:hypothetical protein